jgi:hypothetical protein
MLKANGTFSASLQQLDLHLTLQEEATIMFGHRPLPDGWLGQDAMLFHFQRRPHPKHKKSLGTYGACLLDERSLRALAEEIDVHADSRPFWTPDLNALIDSNSWADGGAISRIPPPRNHSRKA